LKDNTSLQNGLVGHWSFDGHSPGLDRSGNGNHGTLTNGPKPTIGKLGQALEFDGSDDYVNAGDVDAVDDLTSMTISGWYKFDTTPNDVHLIDKRAGLDGWDVQTGDSGNCGATSMIFLWGNGFGIGFACTGSIISTGEWSHWVIVYDGAQAAAADELKIYKNGTPVALSFNGDPPDDLTPSTQSLVFANPVSDGSNAWFDGTMDDVRIYNRALTADEIKRLYNILPRP
jgi:hypothetical protein